MINDLIKNDLVNYFPNLPFNFKLENFNKYKKYLKYHNNKFKQKNGDNK